MITALAQTGSDKSLFGPEEERAIISLLLDFPELYVSLQQFLKPDIFELYEAKYIAAFLQQDYDKHQIVPSRKLLWDQIAKTLTVDDPYKEVLELVNRESDPREVPIVRNTLKSWAEHRTYDLLYSDDALAAHQTGNYGALRQIFDDANRISSTGQRGFWLFEQVDELFVDNVVEHISTGFPSLDAKLNEGGPSVKEMVVWLAPTGVGKTLMLCNNAIAASKQGHNVLFITFELSTLMSGMRMITKMSKEPMNSFFRANVDKLDPESKAELRAQQKLVKSKVERFRNSGAGDIVVYELPPDECTVNDVYAIIENNRRMKGWTPKVVCLDYLELMMSRRAAMNDDDYGRQKSVATECRGLAKNEEVLVYSATQTNRSGAEAGNRNNGDRNVDQGGRPVHLNLDKSAESFGKVMPVDYVISLNQTESEYNSKPGEPSTIRLWIAKNRNGPKFESITTNVFYDLMHISEVI